MRRDSKEAVFVLQYDCYGNFPSADCPCIMMGFMENEAFYPRQIVYKETE